MARYEIGEVTHYRQGQMYYPGDVIEIPDDEEPAPGWTRLDEPKGKRSQAPEPLPQGDKPKRGRGRGKKAQEPQGDETDEATDGTDEEEAQRPSDREI